MKIEIIDAFLKDFQAVFIENYAVSDIVESWIYYTDNFAFTHWFNHETGEIKENADFFKYLSFIAGSKGYIIHFFKRCSYIACL